MPYNVLSVCKDTMLVTKSSMSKLFDELTNVIVMEILWQSGPNIYFIIFAGTTLYGMTFLCIYRRWNVFHMLAKFGKEIPIRKPCTYL